MISALVDSGGHERGCFQARNNLTGRRNLAHKNENFKIDIISRRLKKNT